MVQAVNGEGALAGVELWHGGLHLTGLESRVPTRAPSPLPNRTEMARYQYPRAMDLDDIQEVQGWYAEAARRAVAAGFDIVYVHGAHTQLLDQFLSPLYNKRSDSYGGSPANRARFFRETIELVRAAVDGEAAIAVRLCVDELLGELGVGLERDALPFIELADDLVDLWDVIISNYLEWGENATPSRFYPENREAMWHRAVKGVTSKPVVGVGRFTNPDTMVKVIRDGQLDIIGAARPSISDPFLPNKIKEGRPDDIRECIGCNICVSRWESCAPIICTQNATAGEEFRRGWHPEQFTTAANADNDVLIVGAGPAGMECARVLAARGMRRIHLIDEQPDLGGAMRWIPELPGLGEWARLVNYRRIQLDKARNVQFIPNRHLDAKDVLDYGAELVVIATGATWSPVGLSRATNSCITGADADLPHVLTPEQIMVEGKEVPGESVVVIDDDGYFMGPSLAEKLALEGHKVTIVTALDQVAPMMQFTLELPNMYRRLDELDVTAVPLHYVLAVDAGKVTGEYVYDTQGEMRTWHADAVVLCTHRIPNDALYRALKDEIGMDALSAEGVLGVYRIGDCEAPRLVADCVFDGHRLAREIDSDNPAEPLPYIRERPEPARHVSAKESRQPTRVAGAA
jgi:dimethylamine/trimethylamine dehydrogenase